MQVQTIALLLLVSLCNSSNILTIIPFPSYSHQQPLLAISEVLAKRGHNVTVITTNPPKDKIPNITAIDISCVYDEFKTYEKRFGYSFQKPWNAFQFYGVQADCLEAICDYELSLPQIQNFIRVSNDTTFDVVLIENLMYSSFLGLVHKLGSPPVINVQTFGPWSFVDHFSGIPHNPSYMPDMFGGYTDSMSFLSRVYNTILYWRSIQHLQMDVLPRQEKLMRKHFGAEPPTVWQMELNKSLLLLSSDFSVQYPVPLPPNYVMIGPMHLKQPKPLTKDLEDWFNGAADGVVYFSLGNLMQGTSLTNEWRNSFVKVFAKFPKVRFLWKWESNKTIEGLSDNVLTAKWFPQQDLFAHPKLRVFITQGGLQSMEEVVHYGIPVLGIPIYGDQRRNMLKLEKEGVGISVELSEVSYDTVYNALRKLLSDASYKSKAKQLSVIANDRMVSAADTVTWWTEYIIRHEGAPHLRVASLNLSWYQFALIDVYLFLLLILLTLGYLLFRLIVRAANVLCYCKLKIKTI